MTQPIPALYGVFGSPISHSVSPQIHHAAFLHYGLPAHYLRIRAETKDDMLFLASELKLAGWNVTSPLKETAFMLVSQASDDATKCRAVNTVLRGSESFRGENTDVEGVRAALESAGALNGKTRALVIGAGGAARAALLALTGRTASITVANRTRDRAITLASEFGGTPTEFSAEALREILPTTSLIINTIDPGDFPIETESFQPHHFYCEAVYGSKRSLLPAARERGATAISGTEWLLYQGARAFELFTGKTSPMEAMRAALNSGERKLKNPIALIGMPGTGKSTVAAQLASVLGWKSLDLDQSIEERTGRSISDIFRMDGERAFRKLEATALKEAVSQDEGVIACGGGIVTSSEARAILRQHAYSVFLVASIERLIPRIEAESPTRPLLTEGPLRPTLEAQWDRRRPLYAECADLVVSSNRSNPVQIASAIASEITGVPLRS